MNNPVLQLCTSYIGIRNCGTDINLVIYVMRLMLAVSVNKLYSGGIHTARKHARSVFISAPEGRLGIGKLLLASGRVNNRAVLLDGDKL